MTQAIVLTSQAAADAYSLLIDSKTGPYPKVGVDVGAGVHAAPAQSATLRYGLPRQHPTLPQWAYPYDAVVQTEVSKGTAPIPGGAAVQILDATWTPAVAVAVGQAQVDAEAIP